VFRASLASVALLLVVLASANGSDEAKPALIFNVVQVSADGTEEPLVGAFVYVAPTPNLVSHPTLVAWLKENAQPTKPQIHHFSIVERELVPQRAIFYVGDSVHRRIGDGVTLDLEIFDNIPDSGIDPNYLLRRPESAITRLKAIGISDCKNASILVSDHTLCGITDKNGQVTMARLPPLESIEFRIHAGSDDGKDRFQYSSPTLKFSKHGRFALDGRIESQEHSLYRNKRAVE
jgi:hypothetical protein